MPERKYAYRGFVQRVTERFLAELGGIQSIYNFDLGDEFEIAICKILRPVLPPRFGVCRGHLVDWDGNQAGDDIIIFDRMMFPTLRLLKDETYAQKEWIPIEAAYAYLEAKHAFRFDADKVEDQKEEPTIVKALAQVKAVKELCAARQSTWEPKWGPFGKMDNEYEQANRMYAAILCRNVVLKDKLVTSPDVVADLLKPVISTNSATMPDLIIAGNSNLVVPGPSIFTTHPNATTVFSTNSGGFNVKLRTIDVPDIAFGTGLLMLLNAIDEIPLGKPPILGILNDAFSPTPRPRPEVDKVPPHEKAKQRPGPAYRILPQPEEPES